MCCELIFSMTGQILPIFVWGHTFAIFVWGLNPEKFCMGWSQKCNFVVCGSRKCNFVVKGGGSQKHYFLYQGSWKRIFVVWGDLNNSIFCMGSLENAILLYGGSRKCIFCIRVLKMQFWLGISKMPFLFGSLENAILLYRGGGLENWPNSIPSPFLNGIALRKCQPFWTRYLLPGLRIRVIEHFLCYLKIWILRTDFAGTPFLYLLRNIRKKFPCLFFLNICLYRKKSFLNMKGK